jgi:hypothetical protein
VSLAVRAVLPAALLGLLAPVTAVALAPGPAAAAPATSRAACAGAVQRPFVPTRMSIEHVTKSGKVIPVGRVGRSRVPETPPLTDAGKRQVAWDAQGIRPGAARGTAIFDAHTWPWSSSPALGNTMLRKLHEGDLIVVRGKGRMLCYQVSRRVSIHVSERDPKGFYSTHGPAQIVLTVCSGRRIGPGNWSRRTYWFARPWIPRPVATRPPAPAPPPAAPDSPSLLGGLLGGLFGG